MASALNLAAVHRVHSGFGQDAKQLDLLKLTTVRQLRRKLADPATESVLAATLMLCYSEIIAGQEGEGSWRPHLEGAATLLSQDTRAWTVHSEDRAIAFIAKCFVSLAAIANISGKPPTETVSKQAVLMLGGSTSSPPYIDNFLSYSFELVPVICQVGSLLRDSQHLSADPIAVGEIESKGIHLIQKIEAMIARAQNIQRLTEAEAESTAYKQENFYVNECFHLAVILQIQMRIRRISPATEEVQTILQRILSLLSKTPLHSGPCLGVVLFFPLFTAGCCAIHAIDRMQIQVMLQRMIMDLGFANLWHGMGLLHKLWSHENGSIVSESPIFWDVIIGTSLDKSPHQEKHCMSNFVADGNPDIILY